MSEARPIVLECIELTKSFVQSDGSTLKVLDKLSFSILSGSIVSILGASGCGKTTFLRLLAGLEQVDSGVILSEIERPGRKIGFMQQGEKLLPWRTVLENVALGLELTGVSRERAQGPAERALRAVGLWDFKSAYPAAVSGGMTQRILLARTLAQEPTLLLLDEPLGQLDILGRKELAAIIRNYVDSSGAGALLVTHSVEEAIFIADYVCTLSRRPARIVDRFSLTGDVGADGAVTIDRGDCYDRVRDSLLSALQRAA